MKEIFDFFENMDEYVYAADVETHEMIYMNEKARKVHEIQSLDDLRGRKCYEILRQVSAPCSMCNNDRLSVGNFVEWNRYDPMLDQYLALKDTLIEDPERGRKYRIEIALDISNEKKRDRMLEKQQRMESVVNEMLAVALNAPTPDQSIQIILEQLGRILNGQRSYIFEKNEHDEDNNTYEWVSEGISREMDDLQNLPPHVCADWYRGFQEGRNMVFHDIEQIAESNLAQYHILKKQNIHSLVVAPLYDNGKALGFLGVDNPPPETLDYVSYMLELVSLFIVSCIRRRNLVQQLKDLSHKDALTKLGNRFAMDEYIEQMDSEQSVGVIYCDITGLKVVNDTMGHMAGDALILRACDCLKKTFDGYGIFRIGGDEFLVLCSGIERQAQTQRLENLKEIMEENDVNMAVGEMWMEKAHTQLDPLLKESEKLMYAEKAAYYQRTGKNRRR